MENSGAISPIDRRMARAQETALARFYGLPKVHKEGAALRPIVSLKGTPNYGLAKWLFQRLKFLTSDSNTTVNSSTQFLEKLKGVSLLPSDIMVSFDVTSLFTSIPQDLAVETIELLLREKYDETENRLGHAQIIQLLKFCLKTYFTFDGTIYEQVKGTPMGSPISGLIAEAVLQRLESLVFRHHRPKFWARYVDDTFVVIERDQVLTFKEHLNATFPDIQFTMEEEENNQLAFLDVLVCRKDCGGLKTKVFRKATNTTQILNFNSNHPISHKRSCGTINYRDFYDRYEDDTFCLTNLATDLDGLVQKLNEVQAPLKFAAETEVNNGIVSLDVLLHRREDGPIQREDLTTETIELLLQSKYDETENRLGRAQVLQLLKFCLRTYFTFDGTIYEQVKGTPMGSPISGFIAEAVLQRLESLVFQHQRPKIWARYVDDTFVVIDPDQVLTFQDHLNTVFPDIQFTMEEEENKKLALLDVLVCRKDCGGLKTKSVQESDKYDASTELQQQPPNQPQTQLCKDALSACRNALQ
ncbi:hypothetical protein SprV_0802479100 [Sparganum proliferum]